ncbi:hypothetical protein [Cerina litoralis]|nr:hypothetical protein [Cerina litoralis]
MKRALSPEYLGIGNYFTKAMFNLETSGLMRAARTEGYVRAGA